MRILIAHNHYQQSGGEDEVVKAESALLREFKEDVRLYERSNAELNQYSLFQKFNHLLRLDWSRQSFADVKRLIREFRPDVVHFHNIFFMITPSVYFACRQEGVPVIQSQHNFRLLCSNALFLRDNQICEECTQKTLWRGVYYGCYRNSRIATAFSVNMLQKHWKRKTWSEAVDMYITSTEFTRQKFIAGGIPQEKIVVKPHFVYPELVEREHDGGYVLYAGRLSIEKGVQVLLNAWRSIHDVPLKIMGDGPAVNNLKHFARTHNIPGVEFLGYVPRSQYETTMGQAKFLVVPSICYDNFPRVIAEAYACGIPVLASRIGSMEEYVFENKSGILFNPGNANDLVEKIRWMLTHPDELRAMGRWARQVYEKKYRARENYEHLMNIYRNVVAEYVPNKDAGSSKVGVA